MGRGSLLGVLKVILSVGIILGPDRVVDILGVSGTPNPGSIPGRGILFSSVNPSS